ncbi:hypothetical protein ACOSP7_021788 [Xanthoceras sorbifolium]
MSTNVIGRKPAIPPGLATFYYYPNHSHKLPPTTQPPGPAWNHTQARIDPSLDIKARQGFIQSPPSTSDTEHLGGPHLVVPQQLMFLKLFHTLLT